jgi:hypothetical protein
MFIECFVLIGGQVQLDTTTKTTITAAPTTTSSRDDIDENNKIFQNVVYCMYILDDV